MSGNYWMLSVSRITKAQCYLASQDWNNSRYNTLDINMIPEGWICWSFLIKLETSTETIRNYVKTYCCISGVQAVLLFWPQGLYLRRPSPAQADLLTSTAIGKPCTSRWRGQMASCFTVTSWFPCCPKLAPDWEFEKWMLHCNDLWLVFIIQTKAKMLHTDGFDFLKAASLCTCDCFVITKHFSATHLRLKTLEKYCFLKVQRVTFLVLSTTGMVWKVFWL